MPRETKLPRPWCVFSMRAESIGVSVNATNSDTATANATVMPNCTKKRPIMPFIVATGTNTARIDAVVAMTARPISAVASRAACSGGLPSSRCRWMFSMTTMASSIRMPIDSVSASIVIMLNV